MAATSKILHQIAIRLPAEIRPTKYELRMLPNFRTKTFSGSVKIQLDVLRPIAFVPIHAKYLTVTTDKVLRLDDHDTVISNITPALTFHHHEYEYWVTEFEEPLAAGKYMLGLSFNGSLTDRIIGFYQSSYLDEKSKEKRYIATTKFEPTYARQAFPCFDEPAMKAPFDITIVYPTGDGYHGLSNMDVESESSVGDMTEVHFHESVPMSSYLVCFIVSDMVSKSAVVKSRLPGSKDFQMRVFATPAQLHKVDYSLDTGRKITEFYIEYFNVAYPLPKLDMAAIPDYVSGATEHWGLITYRETSLLYDPRISAAANKQRVAVVVGHELAHMWFGNLVTMKWWNDIWLNEGFASYIEYKGVHHAEPQWDMLNQFVIADLHPVLQFDATLVSHPIVQTVETPSEITEIFDKISYSKGASVIRMLEDVVGEEKFRRGTTKYLQQFRFTNAETADYLRCIEEEGFDFDVKLFMQTWTDQMGYPVVQVAREGNTYTLTQKRFLTNPEDYNVKVDDSSFKYRWTIPITYVTSGNASEVKRTFFNYTESSVEVSLEADVDWIKFNKNQIGYYRVNYDADTWRQLTRTLRLSRGVFSTADRAHLLDDAFALADASQLPFSTALDLFSYLESELYYIPWSVGSSRLASLERHLYYTEYYPQFTQFARKLLEKVYKAVTWNVGKDHLFNLLRVTILDAACRYGVEEALQQARNLFEAWLANDAQRPSPDIRSTVYYYGMQASGSEKHWNQVWQLFVSEQDAQEKLKLMQALAAIKEPWLLQRFINWSWDESYVRGQDYFTCLQNIAANRVGEPLVWDYVRENWPALVKRFGIQSRLLGQLIPAITKRFSTLTKEEELTAFCAKYPEGGAGTAARKLAVQTVKYNIKWIAENKEQIGAWLRDHYKQPEQN